MGSEIVSNGESIRQAATSLSQAASGLEGGAAPQAGSSNGAGYDAMVRLAGTIHPLVGRVAAALASEASAVAEMASTFEQTDSNVAGGM